MYKSKIQDRESGETSIPNDIDIDLNVEHDVDVDIGLNMIFTSRSMSISMYIPHVCARTKAYNVYSVCNVWMCNPPANSKTTAQDCTSKTTAQNCD